MASGANALASKLAKKKLAKKSDAKKTVKVKREVHHRSSSEIPWAGIAKMYGEGKTGPEISDHYKLTKKGNKYPYYLVIGYLNRLAGGVDVNGKTIKINRNRIAKPKASKKSKKR